MSKKNKLDSVLKVKLAAITRKQDPYYCEECLGGSVIPKEWWSSRLDRDEGTSSRDS